MKKKRMRKRKKLTRKRRRMFGLERRDLERVEEGEEEEEKEGEGEGEGEQIGGIYYIHDCIYTWGCTCIYNVRM